MITDDTTYRGRTLGQWVEMAKRSEAEIVRLAGELYERCSGNDLPAAGAPDLRSAITDLSHHLRETADQQPGWKPLLTQAADEIERYYGGMMNWKANAQQKDVQMAEYRAALASAAPVEALTDEEIEETITKAVKEKRLSWLGYSKDEDGRYNIPDLSRSDFQFARAIEARIMGGAK